MAQFAGGGTRLLETQRPFTPREDPRFALFVTGIRLDPLPRQRQSESFSLPPLVAVQDVRRRRNTVSDASVLGFRKLPSIRSAPAQGTRTPCIVGKVARECLSAQASVRFIPAESRKFPRVKKGAWLSTSSTSVSSIESGNVTDVCDSSDELSCLGLQEILDKLAQSRIEDISKVLHILRQLLSEFNALQRKHCKKSVVLCLSSLSVNENQLLAEVLQILLLVKCYAGFFRWYYKRITLDTNFAQETDYLLDPLLEALGSLTPIEDSESCTFAYECLRIMAARHVTRSQLQSKGAMELLILHLQLINAQKKERGVTGFTASALAELLRAVRQLSMEDENDDDYIEPRPLLKLKESVLIAEVIKTLKGFLTEVNIVFNLSRIMSFTSAEACLCSQYLNHNDIFTLLTTVLQKYPGKKSIVVRIAFVLGNLVSVDDRSRERFVEIDGNMASLMHVFECYSEKLDEDSKDITDLIIKVLRIVANLSLTPSVGYMLCQNGALLELLFNCLRNQRGNNNNRANCEYLNAVLLTLNNITFYEADGQHLAWKKDDRLFCVLITLIADRGGYSTCTALRVLANISRWAHARKILLRFLEPILNLLDAEKEVAQLAMGICVNLTSDPVFHDVLQRKGIMLRMLSVLQMIQSSADGEDVNWMMALLTVQCLWNLMSRSAQLTIAGSQVNELMDILLDLMDEELQLAKGALKELPKKDACEVNTANGILAEILVWEEFAVLAGTVYDACANSRVDLC